MKSLHPWIGLLALVLAGCGATAPAPAIRDLRPTRFERGDVITVEGNGPVFQPGYQTVVRFDNLLVDGQPLSATARVVTPSRLLFDIDAAFEAQVGRLGGRILAATAITVEQSGSAARTLRSAPGDPFPLDIYPSGLRKSALGVAERFAGTPVWLWLALFLLLGTLAVALPVPVIGGLVVVWERKISAYMQSRLGPNRVGPNGWLQWLADGVKLILKEETIPADADHLLFRVSPYFAFIGLFLVFMVLPFTSWLIVADLNIGMLFLLSVTSLVVVSIIMGGWSSNSKWSLLGGMRSAAQIISYELPASVALLSIATLTGSLSTVDIVRAQAGRLGGMPWDWYMFRSPFTFACFFIYFISTLAEGNRTPFDLPEAESELVSGYNTEYSGFRYAIYPLVEWVNVFVIGAVATTLFLGGWLIPGVSVVAQDGSGWLQAAGFVVFLLKTIAVIFVIIWIRWTLPRFRIDQMMGLCWKYLIPIAFACFIGTVLLAWLLPTAADQWVLRPLVFLVGGVWPLVAFVRRVRFHQSRFKALTLNPMFTAER